MDDLEFVQKCVKKDKLAWEEFLEKYSRLIYNYIYKVLNSKIHSVADHHIQDIFQEIFCMLVGDGCKKLKTFKAKNGCSLASWLRQVTINFTIDYIRRIKPALSLDQEIGDGLTLKEIIADSSAAVIDNLVYEEKVKALKDCVRQLDREEKYFIELNINKGLDLQTLMEHFKISRGAIDMRKWRILERLRKCFEKKGIFLR